ncbi:hypothetical protein AMATHDRAFT_45952 [Amanita thiersii Skay4041]|uniref:PCI domain-containing protein n=1 Tax=Amanita thiersii Skay4041 TaxID=703135 RepID=A0A2A9NQA3_9AGAR|nr:hypothetical protein AMATHDRAFT_45952 [Amanita thiersii Skay4041]
MSLYPSNGDSIALTYSQTAANSIYARLPFKPLSSILNFVRSRACRRLREHIKSRIWLKNVKRLQRGTFFDATTQSHLAALYDTLLEQNLCRTIEPYFVVEVDHVAEMVGQGRQAVKASRSQHDRLSQMILDKVFHGVLAKGRGKASTGGVGDLFDGERTPLPPHVQLRLLTSAMADPLTALGLPGKKKASQEGIRSPMMCDYNVCNA